MEQNNQQLEELLSSEIIEGGWPWKLFLTALTMSAAVILSYIGIVLGYTPYLGSQIRSVNKQMSDLERSLPIEEQQQFLKFYSQIVNMKGLLDTHTSAEKFLAFLEKNTNRRTTYENLRFDVARRELFIDGVTDSYTTLGQTLQAFEVASEVEKYAVSQARAIEGRIRFRLTATMKPQVLQP